MSLFSIDETPRVEEVAVKELVSETDGHLLIKVLLRVMNWSEVVEEVEEFSDVQLEILTVKGWSDFGDPSGIWVGFGILQMKNLIKNFFKNATIIIQLLKMFIV